MKLALPPKKSALSRLQRLAQQIADDKVTVYAAQASFFTIIAVVPFLSLVISILSFFIPRDLHSLFSGYALPKELTDIIGSMLTDLRNAPKVSLLSFSAIAALWSSSKGTDAIRAGIETVYSVVPTHGFILERLKSLLSTLIFIVLILAMVVVLMFGEFLGELFHLTWLADLIVRWSTPLLLLLMCAVFTAMYASTARRGQGLKGRILYHLPGAVFSSVGWLLFSYFYSLYIRYFPSASYIYGGLAAVCLIMLWLYFCMIILLLGAEVNKLCFAWRIRRAYRR